MSTFRSHMVLLVFLAAAVVALLSGCMSAPPQEEPTKMTIKGSEERETVTLTPAEKAAQMAAEFYRVREIEKAIENYQNAIKLDPEYVQAYEGLGRIYLVETQEFDKALAMYEKARDLAPDDPYTRTSLAYAQSVMGNYQEAVNEYIAAVGLDPTDADAFLNLGYSYEKMGMDLGALNAYRRAYELTPDDARAGQQLASLYYRAGLFDQAIAAYERVRSFGRPTSYTLKTLGYLYMKVGRLPDAETVFLTVLSNEPEDFGSRANLASVYRADGNFAKAAEQYEILADQQSNNIDVLGALADTYNDLGRYDSAIATAQRVLAISPGNGSAYMTWAKALERKATAMAKDQKDYDGAIALFGQAIRELEQARMDPNWSSLANREINRQNQLIEITQQAKLKGIWNSGGVD
jgi:tetratricopeptide (TPR) repeat protein